MDGGGRRTKLQKLTGEVRCHDFLRLEVIWVGGTYPLTAKDD